jgi:hypothetical protein
LSSEEGESDDFSSTYTESSVNNNENEKNNINSSQLHFSPSTLESSFSTSSSTNSSNNYSTLSDKTVTFCGTKGDIIYYCKIIIVLFPFFRIHCTRNVEKTSI